MPNALLTVPRCQAVSLEKKLFDSLKTTIKEIERIARIPGCGGACNEVLQNNVSLHCSLLMGTLLQTSQKSNIIVFFGQSSNNRALPEQIRMMMKKTYDDLVENHKGS